MYALNLSAQHSTSSPYSRFGIGDMSRNGNSQTYALGNVSTAIRSPFSINSINPASYSAISQHTFLLDLGINYQSSIFKTENAQQYNIDGNISHFAFAFAAKEWLYFSAGLKPYSYVGYDIQNSYPTTDEDIEDIVSYVGTGGLNKVHIGTAIKLYDRLSIGVNVNYLFGSINRTASAYVTTEGGSSVVESIENNVYKKFIPELGIQYTDSLAGNLLTLGLVFNKENEINSSSELLTKRYLTINGNSYNDTIKHITSPDSHLTIPSSWGVGFSYNINKQMLIAADYYQQDWSKTNLENIGDFQLVKEYTASAGIEFIPKLGGNKLSQNLRYRVGGYFKNSYLAASTENINVSAVTFGMGLPFKGNKNTINFAVELGRRGTTNNGLLQETFGLFSVSFSLHDYWFRKFKID